jgi:hypothetical protein
VPKGGKSKFSQVPDETSLQAIIVRNQEALQVMKEQTHKMAKTIHELKDGIARLSNEEEITRLKAENDIVKRLYGKLLHKSKSKPPQVGELIKDLQSKNISQEAKIDQLEEQIKCLKGQSSAAPNSASDGSRKAMLKHPDGFISPAQLRNQLFLKDKNTSLEKDNKKLTSNLTGLKLLVDSYKDKLQVERENAKLNKSANSAELIKTKKELAESVLELEREMKLRKKLVADSCQRMFLQEIDDKKRTAETKLKIDKFNKENKSLKKKLKKADSEADDTKLRLATVKSELAGVKDKLAASLKEVEVAETKLIKVTDCLAASQKKVEVANTELTKVTGYFTASENKVSFLHEKLDELTAASRAEVEVLQAELQRYHDASGPVVGPHYAETLNLLAACFHQPEAVNKVELYLKGDVQDHPLKPHGDIDLYVSLIVGGEAKIDSTFQQEYLSNIAKCIPSSIFNIAKVKRSDGYSNIKFSQQGTSFDCCLYPKPLDAVLNESSMFTAGAGLTPIVFSDETYSYGERIYSEGFKSYILNLPLYEEYARKSLPGEISAAGGDAPADDDLGFQAFMKEYAGRLPFDYTSSEPPNVTHADLKFLIKNCIRCKALGVDVTPPMKSLVTDLIESIPEDPDSGFQPYKLQMLFQSVDFFYIRKLLVDECKSDWLIRAIINKYAPFEKYIDGLCEFESIVANFQLHLATAGSVDKGSVPSELVSSVPRPSFFPPPHYQDLNPDSSGHAAHK